MSVSQYPLLDGRSVPCDEHRVLEGAPCPCLEPGTQVRVLAPFRVRHLPWHQLPVFERIPGLLTRFRRAEGRYLCHRFRESGDVEDRVHLALICYLFDGGPQDHPWAVALNTEPHICRPISAWSETMTHEHLIGSLLAWVAAGPDPVDGLRTLSVYWAQIPADTRRYDTLAQAQWAVTHVLPHLLDGRYSFAGCAEPYPGAWPAPAITAAARGDLSMLWPHLGGDA